MADTQSPWRLRAREAIRAALEQLPPGATDRQKRVAVRQAYPFGAREHHPYKAWLTEVRLALDSKPPSTTSPAKLPSVAVGVPLLDALLQALANHPDDDQPRLALCDYLEETGDARATMARLAVVDAEHVARVLWPGSREIHVSSSSGNHSREIHSRHGGAICHAALLDDHITGHTLLRDPEISRAVRVARAKVVLDLFR